MQSEEEGLFFVGMETRSRGFGLALESLSSRLSAVSGVAEKCLEWQ